MLVILLMASYAELSFAQLAVRPGDEPLQLEMPNAALFEDTPYEAPSSISREKSGLSIWVRTVEIAGSSVYEPSDFRPVVQPFLNRNLDTAGLAGLVQAVTQLYIQDGYLSSGAVLPDQDLDGGVVVIQVIEGRLTEVRVEGAEHFKEDYFIDRLRHAGRTPVQIDRLTDQIAEFQRAKIHALNLTRLDAANTAHDYPAKNQSEPQSPKGCLQKFLRTRTLTPLSKGI